jgi:hypothetical protein
MGIARSLAMHNLRFLASLFLVAGSLAVAGCTDDDGVIIEDPVDGTLTVDNQSSFAIVEIRVTPAGSSTWGPDLLRGDILLPDDSITLGVECDFYDALLVDEDGEECEIESVDLCLNDANWVIRDNTCTVFAAKAAAKKAAAEAAKAATGSATSSLDAGAK